MSNMDSELKQKWLDALRSGQYEQGRGTMRTEDNKFCCLGVLCDLLDPGEWEQGPFTNAYFFDGMRDLPSTRVKKRVGLLGLLGPHDGVSPVSKLAGMNDSGYSFTQIADWIEENL